MKQTSLLLLAAALPLTLLDAATPPSRPATHTNIEGYWVGQSEPTPICRVADIVMTATPEGAGVRVIGTVLVEPINTGPVPGAYVVISWTLPGGGQRNESGYTDADGIAHFSLTGPKGLYRISILELKKTGFAFDKAHSEMQEHLDAP